MKVLVHHGPRPRAGLDARLGVDCDEIHLVVAGLVLVL